MISTVSFSYLIFYFNFLLSQESKKFFTLFISNKLEEWSLNLPHSLTGLYIPLGLIIHSYGSFS